MTPVEDSKRQHVFKLFTPARNYRLEARSEQDALEWVALIRREARLEEAQAQVVLPGELNHQPCLAVGTVPWSAQKQRPLLRIRDSR